MKDKAIIVDIDGTFADITHRRHFVEGEKKDWKSFNSTMAGDTVNQWCASLVRAMQYQHHTVVFVTGRHCENRYETLCLIRESGIQTACPWELHNRKPDDFRKDTIIKREIYEAEIKPRYDVVFAIDDRQSVVDMWRSLGVVCLQCDVGNF